MPANPSALAEEIPGANGLMQVHDPADNLCRYYTRREIGACLVGLMRNTYRPLRVLDLASGPGALAGAAGLLWSFAELFTVDINPLIRPALHGFDRHEHFIADALHVDLPRLLGVAGGFDVALCNPPYRRRGWMPGYDRILDEADLADAVTPAWTSTEVIFVAQTLRLARNRARVGLLVPDGLITGRRSIAFRAALLAAHKVSSVVQLPEGAFTGTGARAFILVIVKGVPDNEPIELRRLGNDRVLSFPLLISHAQAENRLDYDYHAVHGSENGVRLRDLGATLVRGEVMSPANWHAAVFHTTHFPTGPMRRNIHLAHCAEGEAGGVFAEAGDILLARVDRNLHRKVCGVASGRMPLSSAVLRLRVPAQHREVVLSTLLSQGGEARLAAISRGVGARMIGQSALMDMVLPI